MGNKVQLAVYSGLMAVIIVSAYLELIPTKLNDIPYFDRAGHFVLYGLWGYFFGKAFARPLVTIGKFRFQAGIGIAVAIALTEEFLQRFSPVRNFSLADLGYGLAGIAVACAMLNYTEKTKPRRF